jgi:transposase
MLTLPAAVRIYVAAEPVDLRRGFDGLAAAARSVIGADPLSGHLFVFLNRRKNRIKLLVWDRTGFLLLYKRLERGTFHIATQPRIGQRHVELDAGGARRKPPFNWASCSRVWTCAVHGAGSAGGTHRTTALRSPVAFTKGWTAGCG